MTAKAKQFIIHCGNHKLIIRFVYNTGSTGYQNYPVTSVKTGYAFYKSMSGEIAIILFLMASILLYLADGIPIQFTSQRYVITRSAMSALDFSLERLGQDLIGRIQLCSQKNCKVARTFGLTMDCQRNCCMAL